MIATRFKLQLLGPGPGARLGAVLVALSAFCQLPADAASKTPAPKPAKADEGFKDFAIITQRNVFNANRNATPAPAPAAAVPKPARPPRVEAFALLGTMSSERGAVAFFDGTSSAYRKAAEPGDQLRGCSERVARAAVLELPAGAAAATQVGDRIELR